MRKRTITLTLVASVFVVGLIVVWALANDQPSYEGKSASSWFKSYWSKSAGDRGRASHAWKAMGTNAIPFLLTQYYARPDPQWRTNLHAVLMRLPKGIRPNPYVPADEISVRAYFVIRLISPPADIVMPFITNRLYGSNIRDRDDSLYLLQHLKNGRAATIPVLRGMLRSTNSTEQSKALEYLCIYAYEAQPAVQEVVEWLARNNSPGQSRNLALSVLGLVGRSASNAVPFLQARMYEEPLWSERIRFAETILRIDPRHLATFRHLLKIANDESDPNHAIQALHYIRAYDFGALASALEDASKDDAVDTWLPAVRNLRLIRGPGVAVPLAEPKLDSRDAANRLNAGLFIVCYEPTHAKAIELLTGFVRDDYWGDITIRQIPRMPNVPDEITVALRDIAKNNSHKSQQYATEALRAIELAKLNESGRALGQRAGR